MLNRTHAVLRLQSINHKRFFWVMKEHRQLLPKPPERHFSSCVHDCILTVAEPNHRWCSDEFEIAYDNGEVVAGFVKECCDREIIPWRAWAERGLPSELVRDMLVQAVEARFGQANIGSAKLEFLGNKGGAYQAHETHALARALLGADSYAGVQPAADGVAESFVNTFKRNYVGLMNRSNAQVVLA